MSAAVEPVLSLRDFRVTFSTLNGDVQAVRGVDLDVGPREMVGVVGESGSGKSVTFLGLLGLLPPSARISAKYAQRCEAVEFHCTAVYSGPSFLTATVAWQNRQSTGVSPEVR